MKTFFNILQTIIGIENKNKTYPDESFEYRKDEVSNNIDNDNNEEYIHTLHLMNKIYYLFLTSNKKHYLSKIIFAKFMALNTVLTNSFYEDRLKDKIFNIFSKTQKHYHSFIRFARIYKIKRNPYVVTDDLMLNPLEQNHKSTFILAEKKSNYLFNINEIISIIETAIGNSPNFFSQPLWPTNPYNKAKFTISTLYNIYFQIKMSGRIMPLLFHLFFLENFNTNRFTEQYESIIRENAIKKYVFNSPYSVLHKSVLSMLLSNSYTQCLTIDKDFPKDLLVNIFRPYLFYFYIINYLEKTTKYYNAKYILQIKLKEFYEYNKLFGRKMFKLTNYNKTIKIKEVFINTNHISFYDSNKNKNNNSGRLILNNHVISHSDSEEDNADADADDENENDDNVEQRIL
jgi:hypothetical protein